MCERELKEILCLLQDARMVNIINKTMREINGFPSSTLGANNLPLHSAHKLSYILKWQFRCSLY